MTCQCSNDSPSLRRGRRGSEILETNFLTARLKCQPWMPQPHFSHSPCVKKKCTEEPDTDPPQKPVPPAAPACHCSSTCGNPRTTSPGKIPAWQVETGKNNPLLLGTPHSSTLQLQASLPVEWICMVCGSKYSIIGMPGPPKICGYWNQAQSGSSEIQHLGTDAPALLSSRRPSRRVSSQM